MTHIPQWQQSTMNGGGFISGLLQDPRNPDILYARSDVSGVFKSVDGGRSWRTCNNGMTGYQQHDVRSFALSPHDSKLMFRGSGSMRGGEFFGNIHKSVDGGEFWFSVTQKIDFYGNGEGRQYGESIVVSPHNPAFVVAGSYSKGLWASHDTGDTWAYCGLKDERISCVVFHPTQPTVLYVGTIGKFDSDPLFVAQQYDYVRPNPPRLYRSADSGVTWEVLTEGMDFGEIVFDPNLPRIIHAACLRDGVLKSADGGYTWENCAPNLSKFMIGTITLDPQNPSTLYAAAETFPNFDPEVPPIGVYRSIDAGNTWQLIRWHTDTDIHNYPSYMSLRYAGWAIAKVRVDPRDSNTLLISNWYGVSISHDAGQTWDANQFKGMENVCIENMVAHPNRKDTVFMVMADHAPKVSNDGGCSFASMPHPKLTTIQPDSSAVVSSRFRPEMVLYGLRGPSGCTLIKTNLEGSDPKIVLQIFATPDTEPSRLAFQSRAAGVSIQALAEDPLHEGRFYAYMDGIIEQGAGLYQSVDWGDTWERISTIFPDTIKRVPFDRFWIENELLSVVISQTKNVCGTNQLLCVDPHREGTLYIGEWTESLYRTTDFGNTWQDISATLPFKRDRASVINVIRADEQKAGVLYAGFIREGLWRSTDYGDTWQKVFPIEERIFNATSVAIGGTDGNLIVVVCEPLYGSPCLSSVMVSRDNGTTWQDVYDTHLGAIRWKTVTLEPHTNRFYAGSCGNSAFVVELD